MGRHASPDETLPDVDLSDELMPVLTDAWEDFAEDGKLTEETAEKLKRTGRTALQGAAAFVFTAVSTAVFAEVQTGNLDAGQLAEVAKVSALTAVSTVVASFLHRKRS